MICTEHRWIFDRSDDAGHMYWHCNNCGETKVIMPKNDEALKYPEEETPDYLEAQGVRIEDFVWWRDLLFQERESFIRSFLAANRVIFDKALSEGASAEDSMRRVYKSFVQYTDYPLKSSFILELKSLGYTEDDYPLPWQLRNRCDKFIWSSFNEGQETQKAFRENAEAYKTMNAFFRALIRHGL